MNYCVTTPAFVLSHVDKDLITDKRVLENMLSLETGYQVSDYCMDIQTEIAPHMRKIVTDWMLEVCEDQQCQPEVFFLAVNYLDRFLSLVNIKKNQFQLLASVCILLASKFSQAIPVTQEQIIIYTDNFITLGQLSRWEIKVLDVLEWELATPTLFDFLNVILNNVQLGEENELFTVAMALATETTCNYLFTMYRPSLLAAAITILLLKIFNYQGRPTKNYMKYFSVVCSCGDNEINYVTTLIKYYNKSTLLFHKLDKK